MNSPEQVFPVGDVGALANGVVMLLEHPELCRRWGRRERERVLTEFHIELAAERYVRLLRQAIQASGAASRLPGRARRRSLGLLSSTVMT